MRQSGTYRSDCRTEPNQASVLVVLPVLDSMQSRLCDRIDLDRTLELFSVVGDDCIKACFGGAGVEGDVLGP